jgi:hypothetical protein
MDFLNTLYVGEDKKEAALGYCTIYEPVLSFQGALGLHGLAALLMAAVLQGADYVGQMSLAEFEQECGKIPHVGTYNFSAENSTLEMKMDVALQINRERYIEFMLAMEGGMTGVKIYTVKPLDYYFSYMIKMMTEGELDACPVMISESDGMVMYGIGLMTVLENM